MPCLTHTLSLLQQTCEFPPTITGRRSLFNLPLTPVHPNIVSTACLSAPITARDTGEQIGPLSPTYSSSTLTPYDRWILHDHKPFWVPTRAFARVSGFPDTFQLYHDPSESVAALARSTSPVTAALTISTALLLIGINLFSSPTSPALQIILQAIPNQIVPDISLRCQLHMIGTTRALAQLILRSTQSLAREIALAFVTHGITSLNTPRTKRLPTRIQPYYTIPLATPHSPHPISSQQFAACQLQPRRPPQSRHPLAGASHTNPHQS